MVGLHEQMWRGPQGAVTELLAVTDNVDILARNAVYGVQPGGQRGTVIAHTDGDPDSAAYSHYYHDHLGTPQVMRDASKARIARQQTSPYGVPMVSAGIPVDVGYTGHKWDQELDSFYAPYRYYNPWNARWSVRDPLGMVDGPNWYLYVSSAPILNLDYLGLKGDWADSIRHGLCVLKCQSLRFIAQRIKDALCTIFREACEINSSPESIKLCYWAIDAFCGSLQCVIDAHNLNCRRNCRCKHLGKDCNTCPSKPRDC